MQIRTALRKTFLCFCAVVALGLASVAWAGPELDHLRADLQRYSIEQSKTPNKIIRYSDPNGNLVKDVLNPQRMRVVLGEINAGPKWFEDLRGLIGDYAEIVKNYPAAFGQVYGSYDQEYLDALESSFLLSFYGLVRVYTLDPNPPKIATSDQAAAYKKEFQDLQRSIPPQRTFLQSCIDQLDRNIKTNKFRPDMVAIATTRLEKLKSIQKIASDLSSTGTK